MDNNSVTIFYLCGIVDDNIKHERAIEFNNSAAENKVLGICDALKPRVKNLIIISAGRGGELKKGSRFPAVARRVSGAPVLYAAFWHIPIVTHLITAFSLVFLFFRVMHKGKGGETCLIAYNRKWNYLPILCVARMFRVNCVLDLEDGSDMRAASISSRLLSMLSKYIFDRLCSQGALLASSLLREQVNQERQFVCHGVSYHRADVRDFDRQLGVPVRFLFGGSLLRETGVQLLIDCVLKLEKEHQGIQSKVKFVVTGFGPMAEDLQVLSSSCGKNWIEYHGSVDIMTYRDILSSVQVAMCLKLPSTEMCSTTFPSKVVEYASFGKAVLTTRIEDVVRLFGEDGAYILQDEKVETLVKTIIDIALNPEDISDIAKEGQARLIERSGKDAVADGVMGLLANFVD